MVNKKGDYEGDAHWDVVEKSIGTINYTDSVDLVYNPYYEQPTGLTTDPLTITEQTQEIHAIEERCIEQAYTMVNMIRMEGKTLSQNTHQKVKVKLDSETSVNLMPRSVYRRINPQMFDANGATWLEKFDKDWTNLVAYGGSIIKQTGVKPVACKWGKKSFITNFHIVYVEDHPVLFGMRYLGFLVEHPLVFIKAVKIMPVHMIKRSDNQTREGTLKDLERSLEVPMVGDMFCSTPACIDLCQRKCEKHRNDVS